MMILHMLKDTSSTLAKQSILRNAFDLDKKVFQYAYHPDKMYFQKFSDVDWNTIQEPNDLLFALLDNLSTRKVTGAGARALIQTYSEEHGDLIKLICNKDLDVGVSVTTFNSVFGKGFIPEFKVQLAKEEDIKNIKCPISGQIKYNGTRVIARADMINNVLFKTRNGHSFEFPALSKLMLETILYPIATEEGCIFDGELTFGDSQGENHARVSGIVNSAIKGTPIPDNLGLVFNVFDFMKVSDFDRTECHKTYRERYWELQHAFLHSAGMKVAETFEFTTTDEIQEKFNEVIENRYEGLILKSWEHKYSFKRSKDWIKLKSIKDATVEVLNVIPGEGKYEDMIGALQCEGIVDGKNIIVNIGSGLSDSDRARPAIDFVGRKIDIQYNEVIANKRDNTLSLFLPRFVCIRGDLE